MLKIITNKDDSILEVKVGNQVNKNDYELLKPELDKKVNRYGKVDLLIRMDDIPDISAGAVIEDIKVFFSHYKDIRKIAVVSDSEKVKKIVKAESLLPGIEINHYNNNSSIKAWVWLRL